MKNIISLHEERLKRTIKDATESLIRARGLVADGKKVPEDLIPRLEKAIDTLEMQLRDHIEDDEYK